MSNPAWKNRTRPEEGVMVLDLTGDLDTGPRERTSEDDEVLRRAFTMSLMVNNAHDCRQT